LVISENIYMWKYEEKPVYRRRITTNSIKKGKVIPLQAWESPEGSRSLGFPDVKTIGT